MGSVNEYVVTSKVSGLRSQVVEILPGFLMCFVVGMAAAFVSDHYGGPTILYAVLMGMAFNYLSAEGRCVAGIAFSAKAVLRFGIALLGARITIEQLLSLGFTPIAIVLVGVPATIFCSIMCGKWLKLGSTQGILSGASVGICGASAALAVSAVLPQDKNSEKHLIFTVITVTALSTVAMISYPLMISVLGFDEAESGIFLGATIHDVAQVVGAGYMVSDNVGDVATFSKLLRVAMLVPVVVIISIIVTRQKSGSLPMKGAGLPLPGFLIAFVVVVLCNSTGYLPGIITESMIEISRWCLIIAMVGLGMKASFKELAEMGWRPMLLMVINTLFLATLVGTWLLLDGL
ncbi:putative sulfate exporter family transporter [Amphritea sp. 2_MG-2023]|uniref:YeiH family protein n=1 Tax=Amphritea TaxID=515417 RepID=UPI001C0737F9|nr:MULTISPECIES: putative sulfate exporter family transporter [Amphritea]MBU2966752.1 putative sulfate exporter family transporter [Amphritea atlantica]MDO6418981.1 putative sulfate exporter family transporter [Amphritea sp. 2_MG-2023]